MKKTVIGIYNDEIFLVEGNDINNLHRGYDGKPIFCVLRPVSKSMLETLRDEDEIKEDVRDIWKEAVMGGHYEGSLDDYVADVIAECKMYDDDEMFPFKDESWLDELTDEMRKQADKFIKEHSGYKVGTWEASGCYEPDSDFNGFDFVFPTNEAKEFAEAYEKERGI